MRNNPKRRKVLLGTVIVEVLVLVSAAFAVGTPVDAEPPTITEQNQVLVAEEFAPEIAANPEAAQLDPATQAQVDQVGAAMTPEERAVFVVGVQAAVIRIKNGEHGQAEQARFAAALRKIGYTPEQAEILKADPIAMNVIPITSTEAQGGAFVAEEMFTGPDGKEYGFSRTAAPQPCPSGTVRKSTHPQMYRSWQSLLGFTLASVSWYRSYCWGMNVVTAVSRWEDPYFNPTGNCLGCSMDVSWHDEYHYDYLGNPWSGYANKVNFNIESCVGWVIGQCQKVYHYWQMNMHGDGTLWWTYDR